MSGIRHFGAVVVGSVLLAGSIVGGALAAPSSPVETVPYPAASGPTAAAPSAPSAPAAPVNYGPAPAPSIVVVDADRVLNQAKAMHSIQSQIDVQQQAFQKEMAQKENELRADNDELSRDHSTLPADQFEKKRDAFEKKYAEAKRDADAKKQALQQGAAEAVDKVKRVLLEVVSGVAQERHANMVVQRNALLYADSSFDATTIVLQRVDERLQSVTVVLPIQTAAAPSAAPAAKK